MKILAVIPARMGSSRFPGKPMAKINAKPMIGHVYERVKRNQQLTETVVATCDLEIKEYIESIGGRAVMTSDCHERCSDRCAEALRVVEAKDGCKYDIVVMVQGDEPMTYPEMITQSLEPLIEEADLQIVNLMGKISSDAEFNDRNCVKVVCDVNSNAMFFSREPIPSNSKTQACYDTFKQVPIIPFRRDFLLKYNAMTPTPLEMIESVDMLRVLENGLRIKMVLTPFETRAVDTPEDLELVQSLMTGEEFAAS